MYGTRLCSSHDWLIREETRVQSLSASLEECSCCSQNHAFSPNLKLACQSREGLLLNQSQTVWFGIHSGTYDKQTTAGPRVRRTLFWCSRLWFQFPLELTNFFLATYKWDSTLHPSHTEEWAQSLCCECRLKCAGQTAQFWKCVGALQRYTVHY